MKRHLFPAISVVFVLAIAEGHSATHTQAMLAQAMRALIYHPQPEYPIQARALRATGAGLFLLRVRVSTGRVIDVQIIKSTGHAILDDAAMRGLKQRRFRPGALPPFKAENPKRKEPWAAEDSLLRVPVNFSLTKT
jgi:TonB family protein